MSKENGKCLCGSVSVSFNLKEKSFSACHCKMCLQWNGGPGLSVVGATDVKFTGDESISVYESSPWGERGFCKKCGSHLFYRFKATQEYYLMLGMVENIDEYKFKMQIYIDSKPPGYAFSNVTQDLTGDDMKKMFNS